MHGSRTTPLMAGNTARVRIQAALLARAGMTSNEKVLEGTRGFADVFSSPTNVAAATDGLGQKFEFLDLAYKPYPCGIVAHAIVDACLQLAKEHDAGRGRGLPGRYRAHRRPPSGRPHELPQLAASLGGGIVDVPPRHHPRGRRHPRPGGEGLPRPHPGNRGRHAA
jgi:hypothetical protein